MQPNVAFWNRFSARALRGMLAGLLLFAALNALSYFARSQGTKLLGGTRDGGAIGFPRVAWATDGRGAGNFQFWALVQNLVVGLAASAVLGVVIACATMRGESRYPSRPPPESSAGRIPHRIARQFTLRGLLLSVACLAVLLSLGQQADERTKLHMLLAIYWAGPSLIAAGFVFASRIGPDAAGSTTLSIAAMAVIAALIVGAGSGIHDMTQVFLGLFVYWTPQCLLLAAALLIWNVRKDVLPAGEHERDNSPQAPGA